MHRRLQHAVDPLPDGYERVPCALCGSLRSSPLARGDRHGFTAYVAICPNDGLVYLDPRWTRERYEAFLAGEYDHHYGRSVAAGEPGTRECRVAREACERLAAAGLLEGARSVLDVGAGTGAMLAWLAEHAPSLARCAVEPSPGCRQRLERAGVEVIAEDVDADWAEAHRGRFDLVTMRHVLEHLPAPVEALRRVARALSPGGALYVAVPHLMPPDASLRLKLHVAHLYYFCETTLLRAAWAAGLRADVARTTRSETWALLRPHGGASPPAFPSVHDEQVAVIRSRRRREAILAPLLAVPRALVRAVPAGLRERVPAPLKDRLHRILGS